MSEAMDVDPPVKKEPKEGKVDSGKARFEVKKKTVPFAETISWTCALNAKRIRCPLQAKSVLLRGVSVIMPSTFTAYRAGSKRETSVLWTTESGSYKDMADKRVSQLVHPELFQAETLHTDCGLRQVFG
ncbi:hypothetical protein F5876DRAFT_64919 [Lentinula aff. lateritia]|uniref:Uncharacterized protein n=1 Tax=Lentinula aff. lateritia TaxID=2804960 RepID=A0ACC1U3A0_9AGAR|nr:hypothetical protein F5876DRAFT_64919 [Lentinula aff. lateritia]